MPRIFTIFFSIFFCLFFFVNTCPLFAQGKVVLKKISKQAIGQESLYSVLVQPTLYVLNARSAFQSGRLIQMDKLLNQASAELNIIAGSKKILLAQMPVKSFYDIAGFSRSEGQDYAVVKDGRRVFFTPHQHCAYRKYILLGEIESALGTPGLTSAQRERLLALVPQLLNLKKLDPSNVGYSALIANIHSPRATQNAFYFTGHDLTRPFSYSGIGRGFISQQAGGKDSGFTLSQISNIFQEKQRFSPQIYINFLTHARVDEKGWFARISPSENLRMDEIVEVLQQLRRERRIQRITLYIDSCTGRNGFAEFMNLPREKRFGIDLFVISGKRQVSLVNSGPTQNMQNLPPWKYAAQGFIQKIQIDGAGAKAYVNGRVIDPLFQSALRAKREGDLTLSAELAALHKIVDAASLEDFRAAVAAFPASKRITIRQGVQSATYFSLIDAPSFLLHDDPSLNIATIRLNASVREYVAKTAEILFLK